MVEAQGVFRESGKLTIKEQLEGAKLAAPMLAKLAYARAGLDPEKQHNGHADDMSMLRFVEMRGGLKSPGAFNQIADLGFKAVNTSGGNVTWEQLRQFMATGGVAAQGLSNQALFADFEPIIGELKGGRAGTGFMTAFNRIEGLTRVPNQVAHSLAGMGGEGRAAMKEIGHGVDRSTAAMLAKFAIWDPAKIVWNKNGGIDHTIGNPLRDAALFEQHPVDFYMQKVLPMYAAMGLKTTGEMNRQDALIFGRTGGLEFSLIHRQIENIMNARTAQGRALGVDASVKNVGDTAVGQEVALQAERMKLERNIGMAILPLYVGGLRALVPLLQSVVSFTQQHKVATGILVTSFAALSGAMVMGGSFMLLRASFMGLQLLLGSGGIAGVAGKLLPLFGTGGGMTGIFVRLLGAVGPLILPIGLLAAGDRRRGPGRARRERELERKQERVRQHHRRPLPLLQPPRRPRQHDPWDGELHAERPDADDRRPAARSAPGVGEGAPPDARQGWGAEARGCCAEASAAPRRADLRRQGQRRLGRS